mmetsp:Transcript_25704/g.85760  ORF Transcript_25704/g.85760 Transcript_25704/m.85760 type:complete len:214 (-) Transcript_25704:117-758(-)
MAATSARDLARPPQVEGALADSAVSASQRRRRCGKTSASPVLVSASRASLFLLLVVLLASSLQAVDGKKKGKAKRRKGNEGQSGQRCVICQAIAFESRRAWQLARTTKSGSPYNYIDNGPMGKSAEDLVSASVQKSVCNRGYLGKLPNPKGYAKHMPTVEYDCNNVLEEHGPTLLDALTLGDEIASYCWEADICGDGDELAFDLKEKKPDSEL